MPFTIYERTDSPIIKGSSASRAFLLRGDNDNEDLAYQAAYLGIPLVYGTLYRKDPQIKRLAFGLWDTAVEYELPGQEADPSQPPQQPQPEQPIGDEWSFNTTGGTEHITQSLLTAGSYPAGDPNVPETEQAIGVSKDGVAGCDIIVPKFEISRTMRLPAGAVNLNYVLGLARATGKKNLMPYMNCGPGELLFLGASGSFRSPQEGWSITYGFAHSESRINFDAGGGIMVDVKLGWDYLWVGYREKPTANGKFTLQKPVFAKVEKVYEDADFQAALGW